MVTMRKKIMIHIELSEFMQMVIRSIVFYLPNIIYIDDFKDIVPEEIKKVANGIHI